MLSAKETVSRIFSDSRVIGVVCNDAGASDIISEIAIILQHDLKILYHLSGPAEDIFHRKGLFKKSIPLASLILKADTIVTGTGWQTSLERDARETAKRLSKKCFVVLDHWQEFRSRFREPNGEFIFPDEILVTDTLALTLASAQIPEVPIQLIRDFHIDRLVKQFNDTTMIIHHDLLPILYLSDGQPYSVESEFSQINQIAKLSRFTNSVANFSSAPITQISVRPHPADISWNPPPQEILGITIKMENGTLLETIAKSSLVIGTDSMALYIAMRLGKRTLTLIDEAMRPLWMDFCVSLEHVYEKNLGSSDIGAIISSGSGNFYLREFSLLDLNEEYLRSIEPEPQMDLAHIESELHSIEIQQRRLLYIRLTGNRCLAIVNRFHQRIGSATLIKEEHAELISVKVKFLTEEDLQVHGEEVWQTILNKFLQKYIQVSVESENKDTLHLLSGMFLMGNR